MIGGYVAPRRNKAIEEVFTEYSPKKLFDFTLQSGDYVAWIFHNYDRQLDRTFSDNRGVIIGDAIPIEKSNEGYRIFDISKLEKTPGGFDYCLKQIVSNVNLISVVQDKENLQLGLASNNASCGRIYYTKTEDNGIIFCNDLRPLIAFTDFQVDYQAYMATIKYSSPPDPLTILKGIKCVPASHALKMNTKPYSEKIEPFFKFNYTLDSNDLSVTEETLKRSMEILNTFDPIIMLSGGVDSTLLTQYLSLTENSNIKACFVGFGSHDPEEGYARYAAEKTGIQLEAFHMESEQIVNVINEMIPQYIQPYSDTSALPSFYGVNQIAKSINHKKIIIDGLGADTCFAVTNGERIVNVQKAMFRQPKAFRQIDSRLFQAIGLLNIPRINKLSGFFESMSATGEPTLDLCRINLFPYDSFFNKEARNSITRIAPRFEEFFDSFSDPEGIHSFFTKSTTIHLIQVTRSTAMKTYGTYPQKIDMVYPFLWRDILVEQGRIRCKKQNGVNKYPLKKLLEKSMPADFVYRKKNAFTPPLVNWLKDPQVSGFAYKSVIQEGEYIKNIMSIDRVQKAFDLLSKENSSSWMMSVMIWGIMFTELWLKQNLGRYAD